MLPDPQQFARLVTAETGLPLEGARVRPGPQEEVELVPADHKVSQTFRIGSRLGWRSVEVLLDKILEGQDPRPSARIVDPLTRVRRADAAEYARKWEGWTGR